MTVMLSKIPLSLYIHIPWCVKKCPYCDFNSHAVTTTLDEDQYVHALCQDFLADLPYVQARDIQSIFIGGGTPSLFSAKSFKKLFDFLKQHVGFAKAIEITLEANPGASDQSRFEAYRKLGINRLSIGVQSFQDSMLKKLGRIHLSNDAIIAVNAAKNAGFENFNIDLMFGLPDQKIQDILFDLQNAINLNPSHLSWYQLTLEPNTVFYTQPPILPDIDQIFEMQQAGFKLLAKYHYSQYEVSAFSQANKACRHNKNYWEFGDYIGIGAGAHGKITLAETSQIIRSRKCKQPQSYLQAKNFNAELTEIKSDQLIFEFMLNALRLYQKISFELFEARCLLARQQILAKLDAAKTAKLLNYDSTHFWPTKTGRNFLNDLQEIFLP